MTHPESGSRWTAAHAPRVPRALDVQGELLSLALVAPRDAAEIYRWVKDEAVTRWLAWDGPSGPEEVEAHCAQPVRLGEDGCDVFFALRAAAPAVRAGELVGGAGLRFAGHPDVADLGYWVRADRWGKGYGSEAVRLLAWLSFEGFGAELASARVIAGNEPSRRVLEKAGFRLTHEVAELLEKRGRPLAGWIFTLSRADWAEFVDAHGAWGPLRAAIDWGDRAPRG